MDPLTLLAREDKWFLGDGKGAIYAPPFPRFLHHPGFWDECYLADIRLNRIFTAIFLDARARPVRFRTETKGWRPDRLILEHSTSSYRIREIRVVVGEHCWISEFEMIEGEPLDLCMWSLQDLKPRSQGAPWQSVTNCSVQPESISFIWETAWPSSLEPDRTAMDTELVEVAEQMGRPLPLYVTFGADSPRASFTVNLAQRHDDSPLCETSVLPEKFSDGKLRGDQKVFVGPGEPEGMLHMVQHYRLEPGQRIQLIAAAALTPDASLSSFEIARSTRAVDCSEESWRAYFKSVPQFSSSDPWIKAAYWYRWYGLRLNTVDLPDLPIATGGSFSPFVTEGVGFFRNFVTYSAQAHLREAAWMHSPRLATGILENLGKIQREDGSFPGHNYSCRPARDFYHTDFATGARLLQYLHELGSLPTELPQVLLRYGRYFMEERAVWIDNKWGEPCLLFQIFDQNEIGQEYMSRYSFADPEADQWGTFRVCGVDAATYMYSLFTWLDILGFPDFRKFGSKIMDGLEHICWQEADSFYADVLPDGTPSPARPATGFYPLMTYMGHLLWHNSGLDHGRTVKEWLADERHFWLKGFPAHAISDPTFSAEGEWKQKRLNCPWSGRSWPMTNSHIVDAIASLARNCPPAEESDLRRIAAESLLKTVRLMFHDGDPARPNSYEHYNPRTGMPAFYRGYDDYMHSWIVDLIMRHAVGVEPGRDEIDPLPLGVDWIECTDIPHLRGRMHVRIERDKPVWVKIEPQH